MWSIPEEMRAKMKAEKEQEDQPPTSEKRKKKRRKKKNKKNKQEPEEEPGAGVPLFQPPSRESTPESPVFDFGVPLGQSPWVGRYGVSGSRAGGSWVF